MGNKKNRKNSRKNTTRHVYGKKKLPWEREHKKKKQGEKKVNEVQKVLSGCRIVRIENLQHYTNNLTAHASHCDGSISLSNEKKYGLASVISGSCSSCDETIVFKTSETVKLGQGHQRLVQHYYY